MSISEPSVETYRAPQPDSRQPDLGQSNLKEDVQESGRTAVSYLFWIACCAGFFGLHRLYNGKIGTGLLWMFTFGASIKEGVIRILCKRFLLKGKSVLETG